jgi:hypothetical protein
MSHLYFKVAKTSPVMEHLERWKKATRARNRFLRALRKEFGIPKDRNWYGYETSVSGIGGPKLDLPGWRWHREGFNVPALNTPEGRAIKARMKDEPRVPSWRELSGEIFQHGLVMGANSNGRGLAIHYASFAWNKKGVVCCMAARVKKAAKVWPKGLTEITGSEAEKFNGGPIEDD